MGKSMKKYLGIIALLVTIGIIVKVVFIKDDRYYERLAITVIESGNQDQIDTYIKSGDMPATERVLRIALRESNLQAIKYLVSKGVDLTGKPDPKDASYSVFNPLFIEALQSKKNNNLDVIQYLFDSKVDFKFINTEGENLLQIMIKPGYYSGFIDVSILKPRIEKLVELGVDINHQDNYGNTPLMTIIDSEKSANIAKILIDNDAEVNIVDKNGNSALYKALDAGIKSNIDLLLQHDAKAYKDGKEVSTTEIIAQRQKEIEAKRDKEAPRVIQYWKDFIRAWNMTSLSCEFRTMGGDGIEQIHTYEDDSRIHMYKHQDGFIFGGCSHANFYHYRIYDDNNNLHSEQKNLAWYGHRDPIYTETGKPASIWFEESFQGKVIWYYSDKKIDSWDDTVQLPAIKEYSIYVQEH